MYEPVGRSWHALALPSQLLRAVTSDFLLSEVAKQIIAADNNLPRFYDGQQPAFNKPQQQTSWVRSTLYRSLSYTAFSNKSKPTRSIQMVKSLLTTLYQRRRGEQGQVPANFTDLHICRCSKDSADNRDRKTEHHFRWLGQTMRRVEVDLVTAILIPKAAGWEWTGQGSWPKLPWDEYKKRGVYSLLPETS